MLGIHVSEGTAEGWFGQGKSSAIISILILIVLIAGIAFGIFAAASAWTGTSGGQPSALTPTPAPKPAPVAEKKPEAKASGLTLQEFIANSKLGKYKEGDILEVSGIYEGKNEFSNGGQWSYFYYGPKTEGLYLMCRSWWMNADTNSSLGRVPKGSRVVIRGKYLGPSERVGPGIASSMVLNNPELISVEK